ncbi:MAG: PDZ domain-containing protein [Pirellulaceae bacterium]
MNTSFCPRLATVACLVTYATFSFAQQTRPVPEPLPSIPTPEVQPPDLTVDETLLNDLQPEGKPRLGLIVEELTPQLAKRLNVEQGVYVASVEKGGPAEKAGISAGDVIVSVGDRDVGRVSDLMAAVAKKPSSKTIKIVVKDDNGTQTYDVTPIMVVDEPIEPLTHDDGRPGIDQDRSDEPQITGDIIRQLMDQFGPSLDGRTLQDLGGLAEQLLQGDRSGLQPAMQRQLKIEINRNDRGPADVFVEIDGEQYKTDGDHLGMLPKEVEVTVSELLGKSGGGGRFDFGGIRIDLDRAPLRQPLLRPRRPSIEVDPPSLRQPNPDGNANDEVDQLRRELEQLQRRIDQLSPNQSDFD